MLADAYLKGLLAAHHDGRAESAAEWTPADFVSCTQVLQPAMTYMQWGLRLIRSITQAWRRSYRGG